MKTDIMTMFADATCQTLKLLLDIDALAENTRMIDISADSTGHINVSIGITGDLSGEAFYRFPADMTLEIVKIMSGMEFAEVDEFVTSALGEVANIISGNAVTDLTSRDITCDILPPRILEGGEVPSGEASYVFSTKVNTSIGEVEVLLRL